MKMMRVAQWAVLPALLILLYFVWPARKVPLDSWYSMAPSTAYNNLSTWTRIGQDKIFIPADGKSAIAALETVAFKELDAEELKRWAGKPIEIPPGQHALLIRGLTYDETSGFLVREKDGQILVVNQIFSKESPPMTRKPIIVIAHRIPTLVYVTCAVDE